MSVEWLQPNWPAPAGIHAISTFRGGGMSTTRYGSLNLGSHVGDDPAAVAENRARLKSAANLPGEPEWLTQVHGVTAVNLDQADRGSADAAFTKEASRVCAILSADCLPVLLASETGEVIGAAHAGWRGLAAGVLEAAVTALGEPASRLLAWLGPAIGPAYFEVGAEVREALLAHDAGAKSAFQLTLSGRYMADLPEMARRRLRHAGVERIYGGQECTYSNSARYFSHRRDGVTGRQATLIWREKG